MLPPNPGEATTPQHHATVEQTTQKMGNVEYAYRFFISKGLSPQAAAGIVGNLKAESGVDPTNNQNDGGPGRGIAQWSAGGRWDQLLAWANSRGYNPNLLDTQLNYVWRELNTSYGGVLAQLRSAKTVQDASNAVLHDYESPADQSASVEQYRASLGMDTYQAHPAKALPNGAVPSGDIGVTRGMGDVAYYGKTGSGGGAGGGSVAKDKLDPQQLAAEAGWEYDFLKTVPELWRKFQEGVAAGWSGAKFASEIKDTNWYQNHAAEARQNLVAKSVDHATWVQDRNTRAAEIMDAATQMGAVIGQQQANKLAEHALMMGWQVGDARLTDVLAGYVHRVAGTGFQGQAGANEDYLMGYANDMGVHVSRDWAKKAVVGMAGGDLTQQEVTDHIRKIAASAFPSFRDELAANPQWTMKDIASPYLNSYASILEKNPAEVNLMTPDVRKALTMRNDKGQANPQSLWDFEQSLRSKHEYGDTKQGYQDIVGSVQGVLKDFGFGW